MVRTSREVHRATSGGAIAGLAAGTWLTLFMTVMSAARGGDIWHTMKGASGPFVGERAMQPGFDLLPVLLGLTAHLAISVGWGVVFGLIAHGLGGTATMGAGAAWGFVVWLAMYYVVLPIVGLASMRADAPVGRAIAFHLVFSLATAAALLLHRYVTAKKWSVPARLPRPCPRDYAIN